jgi:hypothetical protein
MHKILDTLRRAELRFLGSVMLVGASIVGAGMFGTADSNLTSAVSQVTSYFTSNVGTIITAVVGIAVFIWLLRLAFRSFGVSKPRSVD